MVCKELDLIRLEQSGCALVDVENVLHQGIEPIRILSEVLFYETPENLDKSEIKKFAYVLHDMIVDFEKHLQ